MIPQRMLLALCCTPGLAGCAGPLSTLAPGGPAAASIATLWWVMLAGAVAIFVFTMGLFALAYRSKAHGDPSVRVWIKGLGIAFPTTVLMALLLYGLVVGEKLQAVPAADVVEVAATGRQWEWHFWQPLADGRSVETVGVLHIPAGRPIDVVVRSDDVIHSFWVPMLAGKMDAIPGKTNRLRLMARQPGRYEGVCAEFCGLGHTGNRFVVVAHDRAGWAALPGALS
ncbi:cytochrome c oxidase subunit II [Polymorphobacter fuscus]|uniref:cytochrome c oxidase subunit II n=1 Tax=Sandarakinorhabdus fusca TaxID=1439888 RepID=UPI00169DE5D0|nr:cytochrome B [Polymorphobacter fuscus]NJC09990.1 cytochrome c oxidase subunit 2/cytochrome aa3-600 menaquinol oxidase subunit 2 [Polymorphobacter fuscus]